VVADSSASPSQVPPSFSKEPAGGAGEPEPASVTRSVLPKVQIKTDEITISSGVCRAKYLDYTGDRGPGGGPTLRWMTKVFFLPSTTGLTMHKVQDLTDKPSLATRVLSKFHVGMFEEKIYLIVSLEWWFFLFVLAAFLSAFSGASTGSVDTYQHSVWLSAIAFVLSAGTVFNFRPISESGGRVQALARKSGGGRSTARLNVEFAVMIIVLVLVLTALISTAECMNSGDCPDENNNDSDSGNDNEVCTAFDRAFCDSDKCGLRRRRFGCKPSGVCEDSTTKRNCIAGWFSLFVATVLLILLLIVIPSIIFVMGGCATAPTGDQWTRVEVSKVWLHFTPWRHEQANLKPIIPHPI